jgi:hypothetical protein
MAPPTYPPGKPLSAALRPSERPRRNLRPQNRLSMRAQSEDLVVTRLLRQPGGFEGFGQLEEPVDPGDLTLAQR